ncbi:MAG: patatin-like protein [Acidimicrobiales bacterium]
MDDDKRIETRISLVLYGGVSLAIYMSGACQELLALVRSGSSAIPDEHLSPVEVEYRRICRAGGRRVVVDVLAGSSAGGLNALFLAKALAHGGKLDSLRDVWHNQADVLDLMALEELGTDKNSDAKNSDDSLGQGDDYRKALLDGRKFHQVVHDALQDLSKQGAELDGTRLVDDVDCYVTTTDLRGVAETVRLDTTGAMVIEELRRRGVFHFTDRRPQEFAAETKTQLDADHDAVLAFAGRATAAFPGAFQPAQWNDVESKRVDADNRAPRLHDFLSPRIHPEGGLLDLQERWYTDGGAMDNKPFKYALEPLRNRRAEVPVDRKVILIEPDPVAALDDWHRTTPPSLWSSTGGTYGLARAENIREDIAALAARNEAIASLNSALVGLFQRSSDEVRASLETRLPKRPVGQPALGAIELVATALGKGYSGPAGDGTGTGMVDDWINQPRAVFGKERGWGAVVLEDYRWRAMVSQLIQSALTVGDSQADQALVAKLVSPVEQRLREWVNEAEPGGEGAPNPVRKGLKLLDVEYRLRRFTLIEHLLSHEQQRILDRPGPRGGYDERFAQCVRLRRTINELYDDLNNYLQDRRSELIIDHRNMTDEELLDFVASDAMFEQIEKTVDDLDDPLRRASRDGRAAIQQSGLDDDLLLLVADAWVNYGDYDQLILPLADTAANKFGAVDAVRISPLDARQLVDEVEPGSNRRKLGGNALEHVGGFIDADWRLTDITWGRFDTAEVVVRQVLKGSPEDVRLVHDAILAELVAEATPDPYADESDPARDGMVGLSPLDALLKVNANRHSDLHSSAEAALENLRNCEPGEGRSTPEEVAEIAEAAVDAFGRLLRGPTRGPADGPDRSVSASVSASAQAPNQPWSVDLSATDQRKQKKKLVLNQGAALLGRAVALSDQRRRSTRVVTGWLLSISLRLALPRTRPEKTVRHGLPAVLIVAGLFLLALAVGGQPVAAGLTIGAVGALAYAVYARAKAFGARYYQELWRGLGTGAAVGAAAGLAVAVWFGAGSAGMTALAVVLVASGVVMALTLRMLERVIQQAGHPTTTGGQQQDWRPAMEVAERAQAR